MLRIMLANLIYQGLIIRNMVEAAAEMQDTNEDGSQTFYWLHKEEGASFTKYLIVQIIPVEKTQNGLTFTSWIIQQAKLLMQCNMVATNLL